MPRWTRQTEVSSSTPVALGKTAWLAPLAPRVEAAIDAYLAANPAGEDVTRAVLAAIGPIELERLAGAGNLDRAKRDVGMFVAQTLAARFGAINVETWRTGRTAVTRANRDPSTSWVKSYTPHRVRRPA